MSACMHALEVYARDMLYYMIQSAYPREVTSGERACSMDAWRVHAGNASHGRGSLAELQEVLRWWIVRRTDGVTAHLLQDFNLSL